MDLIGVTRNPGIGIKNKIIILLVQLPYESDIIFQIKLIISFSTFNQSNSSKFYDKSVLIK